MDRQFRATKLELHPEEEEAKQIYDSWLRTFDIFWTDVTAAAEDAENVNKLELLINFLTHRIFTFFSDATTYAEARTPLDNAYRKRKSNIFAHQLLKSRN